MLGLPAAVTFGPFKVVELGNGVSMDFMTYGDHDITPQHYAFLVSEDEFDEIFGRIKDRGLEYWADPAPERAWRDQHPRRRAGRVLVHPDGHLLEIITRPYGSGD